MTLKTRFFPFNLGPNKECFICKQKVLFYKSKRLVTKSISKYNMQSLSGPLGCPA